MSEKPEGSRVVFITDRATKSARLHYRAGQHAVVISVAAGHIFRPFVEYPSKIVTLC